MPANALRLAFSSLLLCVTAACQPQAPAAASAPPPAPDTATAPTAPEVPREQGQTTTYRYQCGELDVTASFHGEGDADISFNGRILKLPHAPADSGARYADANGNEFWSRADAEASLQLAGEPPRICHGPAAAFLRRPAHAVPA